VTAELRTYRPREDVQVWETDDPRGDGGVTGYWRDAIVMQVGPTRPPRAVLVPGLAALPAGTVRLFLLTGQREGHMRGQTITHDTTDPDVADCVRRPDDNDGTPPCTT
jgi:hypothetical protein